MKFLIEHARECQWPRLYLLLLGVATAGMVACAAALYFTSQTKTP